MTYSKKVKRLGELMARNAFSTIYLILKELHSIEVFRVVML